MLDEICKNSADKRSDEDKGDILQKAYIPVRDLDLGGDKKKAHCKQWIVNISQIPIVSDLVPTWDKCQALNCRCMWTCGINGFLLFKENHGENVNQGLSLRNLISCKYTSDTDHTTF